MTSAIANRSPKSTSCHILILIMSSMIFDANLLVIFAEFILGMGCSHFILGRHLVKSSKIFVVWKAFLLRLVHLPISSHYSNQMQINIISNNYYSSQITYSRQLRKLPACSRVRKRDLIVAKCGWMASPFQYHLSRANSSTSFSSLSLLTVVCIVSSQALS